MKKLSMDELNRVDVDTYKKLSKIPLVVVLDNVRSLNNIGSVFRTSDAFRVSAIYLCGITATPPHKEIHKTALGAEESVDWIYFETVKEAVEKLKEENVKIYAIEQVEGSQMLQDFYPEQGSEIAVVFGNEVDGVSEEILEDMNGVVEIPQFGTKHSLNVSVTAGIVIWDLFNKIQ
ncbi:RNA methyltransferase [Bacteroidales bacterium OttesenSCG-928-C19]|nr:RNA methyltransferase [Bacteroidales bacterium OttesenSCG-928-C19]